MVDIRFACDVDGTDMTIYIWFKDRAPNTIDEVMIIWLAPFAIWKPSLCFVIILE